ncbi:MAG: hypothetical protein ABIS50_03795 [Luteolibacter sp.]|uniref:hypothetical protein n=1 Tax=Luteolibacter sp. TaxID=1962973 RepID=UPI003266E619
MNPKRLLTLIGIGIGLGFIPTIANSINARRVHSETGKLELVTDLIKNIEASGGRFTINLSADQIDRLKNYILENPQASQEVLREIFGKISPTR